MPLNGTNPEAQHPTHRPPQLKLLSRDKTMPGRQGSTAEMDLLEL